MSYQRRIITNDGPRKPNTPEESALLFLAPQKTAGKASSVEVLSHTGQKPTKAAPKLTSRAWKIPKSAGTPKREVEMRPSQIRAAQPTAVERVVTVDKARMREWAARVAGAPVAVERVAPVSKAPAKKAQNPSDREEMEKGVKIARGYLFGKKSEKTGKKTIGAVEMSRKLRDSGIARLNLYAGLLELCQKWNQWPSSTKMINFDLKSLNERFGGDTVELFFKIAVTVLSHTERYVTTFDGDELNHARLCVKKVKEIAFSLHKDCKQKCK